MFDFGEHLKQLRQAHDLTQKQLAELTGLHERTVQNYELNTRKPSYEALSVLADYFMVSVDYLMGRQTGEMPPSPQPPQALDSAGLDRNDYDLSCDPNTFQQELLAACDKLSNYQKGLLLNLLKTL